MKDEDYLVHNINKIAETLKKMNWNLGRIMAVLENKPELTKEIKKEIKEDKKEEKEK